MSSIETFHNDIVNAYMSASKTTIPTTSTHTRHRGRLDYHYALRKLKNEDLTLRYEKMSCRVLKNNSKDFWKKVHKVRGNSKTLIHYVDGVQGQDIADLFANKYDILYNSVSYDNTDMVTLKTDIDKYIFLI